MIGLACAWRPRSAGAAGRGPRPRASRPAGATRVAAGMLAPVGELTFGEPELLELTLVAAELYPGFVAELERATGVATGYRAARRPARRARPRRGGAAAPRPRPAAQRSASTPSGCRRGACRELEPGLTPSLAGGVPRAGRGLDRPARADRGAARRARAARGSRCGPGTEVAEAAARGRADRRGADRGRATSCAPRAVVLAAGAWSGQAEWLPAAARPPVRPVKGQILELRSRGRRGPLRADRRLRARLPGARAPTAG